MCVRNRGGNKVGISLMGTNWDGQGEALGGEGGTRGSGGGEGKALGRGGRRKGDGVAN